MSKAGQRLAADYVSAILSSTGIQKAAGPASPALLMAAVTPLCEAIVAQEKYARRVGRRIKRNQRVLDAIAAPAPSSAPSPMRLPRREVPMRAGEWKTTLTPATEPVRNGHHHEAEDRATPGTPPPGHPG